jgi:tricorn protease interacting factor F2/3
MLVDKYKIIFDFDTDLRFYDAEEEIYFKLNKNQFLEIDSVDLEIKELKINDKKVKYEIKKDKILITDKCKKGKGKIFIKFKGDLKESLGGIYLSSYKVNNTKKYLVTTQFEPVDARRAFPCFDDPSKKAVFNLTLVFDKNLNAVSNTLPQKILSLDKKKKVIFQETPKMSTYLLYLGIGDWYFKESNLKNILLRVAVCEKNKLKGTDFAIENAKKFLSYLESYFDFKYPLDKLDLLAIPDFAAGAMENWGAVTFRENLLLFFEKKSSEVIKERIAEVIAHELVHMWFGNLVTMKWWDDLWLNESFATYLAYKAVDFYYPGWKVLDKYVVNEVISALNADALINTHPIKTKIKNPDESLEIFDEISYEKGGSVLKMIENYIGQENFKKGLRYYIKKFAYQNASSLDLWLSLEKFSDKSLSRILKDFIEKSNFPIITLKKEKNKYLATQNKFLFLKNKNVEEKWLIPLFIETEDGCKIDIFKNKKKTFKLYNYLNLNKDFKGFYLVNYHKDIINDIQKHYDNLSVLDKIFLICCFNFLTKGCLRNIKELLEIIKIFVLRNFDYEKNKLVFFYSLDILNYYYFYLENKNIKFLLEQICLKILDKIGWEPSKNEDFIDYQIRQLSLILLGSISNTKVFDFSIKKFKLFLKKESSIAPEIKQAIFINSLLANDNFFKDILNLYKKSNLAEDQNRYLTALGYIKKEDKIKEVLNFLLSNDVRFSQSVFVLSSLSSNKSATSLLFNWIKRNWHKLEEKGGGRGKSDFILIRIIKTVFSQIGPFVDNKEIDKFLKIESLKRFNKTAKVVSEKILVTKKMMKYQKKFLKKWKGL